MSDYNVIADEQRVEPINLTYSKVDPGGLDTCSFELPAGSPPRPGSNVSVYKGTTCVWMGVVEEPGQRHTAGRSTVDVSCVGPGKTGLNRTPYSMIYIDRDLSRYRGPSNARLTQLYSGSYIPQGSFEIVPDPGSGAPALRILIQSPWPAGIISEPVYDVGAGNAINSILGVCTADSGHTLFTDANYGIGVDLRTSDTVAGDVHDARAAGSGASMDLAATTSDRRYAALTVTYSVASADSLARGVRWTNLRVIGTHGLHIRGSTASDEGFYPGDIVRDAIKRSGFIYDTSRIEDASHYTIRHLAEYTPIMPEKWISDVATLVGWHWGIWEPSPLGDTPEAVFTESPTSATCGVSYGDVENISLTERLSTMHDSAIVSYTDAAGSSGRTTVSRAHPRLPDDVHQAIPIDVGLANTDSASALGLASLALDQASSRVAGECELPAIVELPGRGEIPSDMLRPGLDRIQIRGIPSTGSVLLDTGAEQVDHFRISRLTVTIDQNGHPKTRISFDSGRDLADTLNARLRLASALSGVGG